MEHHSNQTSWLKRLLMLLLFLLLKMDYLGTESEILLEKNTRSSFKIASITSCSNVTGIRTPYHGGGKNNAPTSRTLFC
jgi:selenocysteine lyase/cysteine desulfurase